MLRSPSPKSRKLPKEEVRTLQPIETQEEAQVNSILRRIFCCKIHWVTQALVSLTCAELIQKQLLHCVTCIRAYTRRTAVAKPAKFSSADALCKGNSVAPNVAKCSSQDAGGSPARPHPTQFESRNSQSDRSTVEATDPIL